MNGALPGDGGAGDALAAIRVLGALTTLKFSLSENFECCCDATNGN